MSMLNEMWSAYNEYEMADTDWITNPFGWPTIFGIGAAEHPVEPSHCMIWMPPRHTGTWVSFWDERLQLEYGASTGKILRCVHCKTPSVTNLDGDELCWLHANEWVRGEGLAQQEYLLVEDEYGKDF